MIIYAHEIERMFYKISKVESSVGGKFTGKEGSAAAKEKGHPAFYRVSWWGYGQFFAAAACILCIVATPSRQMLWLSTVPAAKGVKAGECKFMPVCLLYLLFR